MFYFDPLYIIMIGPCILLALWAQARVKMAFDKYSKVRATSGLTGADAAREVMRSAGINDVQVEEVQGFLSDHYDPRSKTLRLSPQVYRGQSLASVGVAAHEAGHAIQHSRNYALLEARTFIVPMAGLGDKLAFPIIFLGFIFHALSLVKVGIILFSIIVLFQIITLPVEFDASSRAKKVLASTGIISGSAEAGGVAAVLNAAAMTYVAATISTAATLLYYLLRSGLLGGRR
ncbi:MAG: zinc metallopeptidase [bacterium]